MGYIYFVYNGASVQWITCVSNFRFFTNISKTMQATNMYYISLERLLYSTSARVCCKNPSTNKGATASQRLIFLYSLLRVLFDSLFTFPL